MFKRDNIIISFSMAATITLAGCGGSGGSSSAPYVPIPDEPIDPCAQFRSDGRNTDSFLTAEYCRNVELGRLGTSTAYSEGYTGEGVTIAVLDSGVELNHYDIGANAADGAISFVAKTYDTVSESLKNEGDGVTTDQIEKITLSSGGTGYTTAPTITISGDGTGAEAVAILDGDGAVSGIYLTERGSGYTNATFSIDNNGTDGSGVEVDTYYMGAFDDYGHGTGISSISSGVRQQEDANATYDGFSTHGVAFNSDILAIKVLDGHGDGAVWQIEKGIDYAVDKGAQILNMSIGTLDENAFSNSKSHFTDALAANSSIIVAAGNDGKNCLVVDGSIDGECSFPAALPWLDGNSDMLDGDGAWVVVGSVDSNNVISSFSNRAGVTKDNYIVAGGEGVISADLNGGQSYNTGTSFATPIVSGAMALMTEKYPHLTGKEVAQIFFDTAEDLGEAGIDDIYGNGLIDIYAAFAPVGALGVTAQGSGGTVASSTKIVLSDTQLSLSGSVGASLISSQALESTVAFDDYGRDFNVDMTNAVSINNAYAFDFNNFFMFNYGKFVLGLDQANQRGMIGYKITKNSKIMISADDTLLGSKGSGSLGFKDSQTIYTSLKGYTAQGISKIKFGYQLDYGFAQASASENSLIVDISDIHAIGGSLKAYYGNFGVGYSIPLTAISGEMSLSVPVSRENNGAINYAYSTEKMSNKKFQQDASVFYEAKGQNINALVSYEVIKNLGGIESVELAQRLSLNLHYLF